MSTSEGDTSVLPNVPTTTEVEVFPVDKEKESKGIEIDPISQPARSPESITEVDAGGEEDDKIAPLATPLVSDTSGRLTSQSSVTSDQQESKRERGTMIVRMASKDSSGPSTPSGLIRRKSSIFRRSDSGLSLQESWRKKDATIRQKSSKNFVSFHNIFYTVPQGYFWQHKPPKVILNNVR